VAIMLMTGADERGVQAIEKLTKQKFTPAAIEIERSGRGERSDRGERGERGERNERGGRGARERGERSDRAPRGERTERDAARSYQPVGKPVDDFFLKPYEPPVSPITPGNELQGAAKEQPSTGQRPAKVAALLGGRKP
jgi:hypothetical protein